MTREVGQRPGIAVAAVVEVARVLVVLAVEAVVAFETVAWLPVAIGREAIHT